VDGLLDPTVAACGLPLLPSQHSFVIVLRRPLEFTECALVQLAKRNPEAGPARRELRRDAGQAPNATGQLLPLRLVRESRMGDPPPIVECREPSVRLDIRQRAAFTAQ